ncbi:hypothetical protein QCD60_08545 [Pokkaliibacter sp. MBI-7]|nr:hypothetical protein [Pokkaliibacter sp. MBI-7]MDH2432614.1 hypothetical protein [Pokkaliibacter sp. MBI-7]
MPLQLLSAAKAALGEISRVETGVKVFGMVNAEADCVDHARRERVLGFTG